MGFQIFNVVAVAAIALHSVASATYSTYPSTCGKLAATTDITIEWPITPAYKADQGLYW